MITGQAWFKVPSAIKVELTRRAKAKWVSGKDVILHLIGIDWRRWCVVPLLRIYGRGCEKPVYG